MRNQDIAQLQQSVQDLADIKEQLEDSINEFLGHLKIIEKEMEKEFSTSHLLDTIRSTVENIDSDTLFDFVDDLEAEIGTLSYKYKRVREANLISTHPKNYSPAFYRPMYLGEPDEIFRP